MVKKVLIASGVPNNLQLMATVLRRYAPFAEVVTASGSEEVISRAGSEQYAAVIIDNHLEGRLNGLKVVRQARTHQPDVPIYFVSGNDISTEALDYGASGFISKPLDIFDRIKLIALTHLRYK